MTPWGLMIGFEVLFVILLLVAIGASFGRWRDKP